MNILVRNTVLHRKMHRFKTFVLVFGTSLPIYLFFFFTFRSLLLSVSSAVDGQFVLVVVVVDL